MVVVDLAAAVGCRCRRIVVRVESLLVVQWRMRGRWEEEAEGIDRYRLSQLSAGRHFP